jgi:DNA polymerase-3 subunit alpha
LLSEEFKSLGFYISDHPLNEYTEIFDQLKIISYKEFLDNDSGESLVAGTIMSIQEKKSAKGTPFAIIKFSDNHGEFELFLFADILINNRDKIKESESFILTLQKDRLISDTSQRRVNIRKILNLDDMINKPYSKVTIELKENYNIEEIKNLLSSEGQTQISLIINKKNKKIHYNLQNTRKFDFNQLKMIKSKEYVKKITV